MPKLRQASSTITLPGPPGTCLSVRLAERLWTIWAETGLGVGDKVPGMRAISRDYGVSINVAQAAVGHLGGQGLLEPRRGRGCVLMKDPSREPVAGESGGGVVMDLPVSGSAYMRRYARLISEAGRRHALHFYIYDGEVHGFGRARARALRDLLDGRFAAAVLFHPHGAKHLAEYLARVRRKQRPVVFLESLPEGLTGGWDLVSPDGEAGGRLMAQRLLAAGHQRIGHIGPPDATEPRLKGLREALRDGEVALGDDCCFGCRERLLYQPGGVSDRLRSWLTDLRPTALTLFSDAYFPGLWPVLRELGWEVGRDVSVVSYDAAPVEDSGVDFLSTVDPHQELVAEKVVEVLRKRLAGDRSKATQHWIAPTFVPGGTLCRVTR